MQDIIIIGGGVIGCAIARELSRYKLAITVLEAKEDVACGVSKANSGIIHAGYNESEGSLKAKLDLLGNEMYDTLAKELDFTFKRNGAMILAFNNEEKEKLQQLMENGNRLGIKGLSLLSKEEAKKEEPGLSDDIIAALNVPTSGIVNPYELTIALAENAAVNGTTFMFNSKVTGVVALDDGTYEVCVNDSTVLHAKVVINAAGLYSDKIASFLGTPKNTILPNKGQYFLFNKTLGAKITHTVFQVPTKETKGILVTPTVDGNLLVGPDSCNIEDKEDVMTNKHALLKLLTTGHKSMPGLPESAILTSFSGLRPKTDNDDFIIEEDACHKGVIHLIGIDSPGLTCAPSIALYVKDMVEESLPLQKKESFIATRTRMKAFTALSSEEKNALIKEHPAYGKIVCKCELISEGEIIDAVHRPVGATTVDGVKRRTRATLGGCQGLGCLYPVSKIIARELNIPLELLMKNGEGSNAIGFKEEN